MMNPSKVVKRRMMSIETGQIETPQSSTSNSPSPLGSSPPTHHHHHSPDEVGNYSLDEPKITPAKRLRSIYCSVIRYSRPLICFTIPIFLIFTPWVPLLLHGSDSYAQYRADLRTLRETYRDIPSDIKVSVVIMNHNRPLQIQRSTLMSTLTEHPNVDQIILLHSNPLTAFKYKHPKVMNIDAIQDNHEIGLAIRFKYCAELAIHDWVIIVDDDMECKPSAIDDVIRAAMQNPRRIVGKYGRGFHRLTAPTQRGYNTRSLFGRVEVVLTKFLILEKEMCRQFFSYDHLAQDLIKDSKPLWNGEDIYMSLLANHVYNVPPEGPFNNWAIPDLEVWDSKMYDSAPSVSGNPDLGRWREPIQLLWAVVQSQKHFAHRGRLWSEAKSRLHRLKSAT